MSVASTSSPVATRQRAHLSTRERLVVAALSLCAITLLSVAASYAALTGSRMLSAITDKIGGRFWWVFGAAILLSWGYKMLTFGGLIA